MVAFPGSLPAKRQPLHTGNPVRAGITRLPAPAERFATHSGALRVLVIGGSLGAHALNETVPAAVQQLASTDALQLYHQTGKDDVASVQAAYAAQGIDARVEAFVEDLYSDNGPCSHMPPDIWAGDLFTWQGMQDQCFGNNGYGAWCNPYTIEDEYWIDISCAKTSYIHNFMNKMSLNGVWLAHDYVVGAPPEAETMCNGGVTVEVGAGGLIELKDLLQQQIA